jgi:Family of unknown function (DUF5772)
MEPHSRSCWVNFSFIAHWIEANCLTCFTKDLPVWKDNGKEFYIINKYKFNQQTYSFPIRIEKNKTSTFLKAFEVVQTGPNEYKETKNITELVKQWLGPNQDFYDKVVTPNLLGVSALKVYFVDIESFDTIERIFIEHEGIVLLPEIVYKPPSPRIKTECCINHSSSLYENTESYQNDSPCIQNDPREPRNSFTFNREHLAESPTL